MDSDPVDVGAFGAAFAEFIELMNAVASAKESPVAVRIGEHLGVDPKELPITGADFPPTDHPNLQLALDAVFPESEVIGIPSLRQGFPMMGLAALLSGQGPMGRVEIGPVQYTDIEIGDGRVVRAVSDGVYLPALDQGPAALVISHGGRHFGPGPDVLRLEGVSPVDGLVSSLLVELRAKMRELNVYRGQVISLHSSQPHEPVRVQFHRVGDTSRGAVVLPPGTLERLERHAIGLAEHAERLRAQGRQLKRGVLLHGPPGTGKTLTVNYLLGAMPGRTTVLLNGRNLQLIEPAVSIARELTPATVVLEDVDLVAAERTMPVGHHGILFELLNQMEGLDEDNDLLFLLTTNRPDLIEPALAARPGRIDLALEIPLPDAGARLRLVRLYAGDVPLGEEAELDVVTRTQGLTGAFIKELMRQAGLRAALADRAPIERDATEALTELLDERSTLTRRLLGQGGGDGENAPEPFPAMLHAFGAAGIPMPRPGPG
jgi:cell division protease FtsH